MCRHALLGNLRRETAQIDDASDTHVTSRISEGVCEFGFRLLERGTLLKRMHKEVGDIGAFHGSLGVFDTVGIATDDRDSIGPRRVQQLLWTSGQDAHTDASLKKLTHQAATDITRGTRD